MILVQSIPAIVCCDLWQPGTLTSVKQDAYRRLAAQGMIRIMRVVHHPTGRIVVEYWSQIPHAWTLNHLREIAASLDPGCQMRMEGLP